MLRKLCLSLAVILLWGGAGVANDRLDFTAMPHWGQSRAQIKAFFGNAEPWSDTQMHLVFQTNGIDGYPVDAYHYFSNDDELGSVTYYLELPIISTAEIYAAFDAIKERLTAGYGLPKYDFGPGEAALYSDEFAGAGYTNKHATWFLSDVVIRISVSDKYIIAPFIVLQYTNGKYFPFTEPDVASNTNN